MSQAKAYAATTPTTPLQPWTFDRREPGDKDVRIEIAFCGICHSDLHTVRNEWGPAAFPIVPGHEIAGRVTAVGKKVRGFKAGDLAGVGCMVNSCRKCENCRKGLEQHCSGGLSFTYNSVDKDGTPTQGGYSSHIVVDEAFVLKIAAASRSSAWPRSCARASRRTLRSSASGSRRGLASACSASAASATWV